MSPLQVRTRHEHEISHESWGHESWGDFGALEWIEPWTFLHFQPRLSLCLAWIKKKKFIWSQPQYMIGKKYWVKAQPCMNQEKKVSFGLSLNTWQDKILNWILASNELVYISGSESQSQPWKKLFMTQSRSRSVSGGGGNLKNLSLVENFFVVSNTFKSEGRQK